MTRPLLLLLSVLLAVPNFFHRDINEQWTYNGTEKFDPRLAYLKSVDQLEWYTDSIAIQQHIDPTSKEYFVLLEDVISKRFYHGFSHYTLSENWIAGIGEKITGIGLSCKVDPDAILQNASAACSQQSIVMMDIVQRKQADYRKVGFPHHYAMEVAVNDEWYYFDCNMEPSMTLAERAHSDWKGSNDRLRQYYSPSLHHDLDFQFGHGQQAEIGVINQDPAPHLALFQRITAILSKFAWCFPLLLFAWLQKRKGLPFFRLPQPQTQTLQPAFTP